MEILFKKQLDSSSPLVLGVRPNETIPATSHPLSEKTVQIIQQSIAQQPFSQKETKTLVIHAPLDNPHSHIVLVKVESDMPPTALYKLGAKICDELIKLACDEAVVDLTPCLEPNEKQHIAALTAGLEARSWCFTKYKTKRQTSQTLATVTLITTDPANAIACYQPLAAANQGLFATRNLVVEPPNLLYPETFAEQAVSLRSLGLKIEVLDEKMMSKLGMHALLGVGQGSTRPPRLVIMHWNKQVTAAPLAIIGKGVTFDTGGISLKPSANMEEMKSDMAGAAVVFGLMKTLALRQAPANVVGIMALAENMPSGNAQRPADVVKSMSGQTIEVINTDAEGRLVLADAISYATNHFKPCAIIDIATLTGAIVVALGSHHAGLFSNDDTLATKLLQAGEQVDEKLWRLPLGEEYDRTLDSDIADVKNVSNGREAGSITAAQFLQRFVEEDIPWAHIDIAGTAWSNKKQAVMPKSATGFGVRLLDQLIKDHYQA